MSNRSATTNAHQRRSSRTIRRVATAILAGLAIVLSGCDGPGGEPAAVQASESTPVPTTDPIPSRDVAGESVTAPALIPAEPQPAPTSTSLAEPDSPPPYPDVLADTVAGGQIDFGSLQGQDIVLWFWAPW